MDNRDKQIEEMAKDFCALNMPCEECHLYKNRCHAKKYATRAYNAGYRKSTDVAEEIFSAIEFEIHNLDFDREETRAIAIEGIIAILKKKYTGEDTNVTTNTED